MPPNNLPDDWLDFYMWAISEAFRESDGMPETKLFTQDGETL